MTTYDYKPIPTRYRGRQYRSRLEARWSAFFDLAGWRHEYEPLDLGGWSPDFLLVGYGGKSILVEVKPIIAIDHEICDKMARAANERKFRGELLLLGLSPFPFDPDSHDHAGFSGWLGWLEQWPADEYLLGCEDEQARARAIPLHATQEFHGCLPVEDERGRIDFCHTYGSWRGLMTGAYEGRRRLSESVIEQAKPLWARAGDAVQWSGP